MTSRAGNAFPIVGIGGSAGGLEAFLELLKYLPADTGLAFVFVQHLDPEHESALPALLARGASMPVCEVSDDLRVEPNRVYVISPGVQLRLDQGRLKVAPRRRDQRVAHSIDFFFESLAADRQERAIGVVLSGTATDGTLGLEAIKAGGGVTLAQDDSAKYDGMPRSAIAAGCVDLVMPPRQIAAELVRIAQHPSLASPSRATAVEKAKGKPAAPSSSKKEDGAEDDFKRILLLLRNHCDVDFSLYKTTTIRRRITRRLVLNKQATMAGYAASLRGNTQELDALYSDLLINVTSFFRNADAFDALRRKVFPKLLAQRGGSEPVRIWVLGCSTGQEAYSIAMVFAEVVAREERRPQLQIFATDLNEEVLRKARAGLYPKSLAQEISPARLRRFFVEEEGGYRIDKALRDQVVFARQNVLSDPPFSRMDLITCRNLLIYLEPEIQKKILPAFHYALKPGGFLFLGASESIGQFAELFLPADKKDKLFVKKVAPTPPFRLPFPPNHSGHLRPALHLPLPRRDATLSEERRGEFDAQREADRVTLRQFGPPGVLIDAEGNVLQFRGATGAFLEQPSGKGSLNVLTMAREGLMLPLRAALNRARRENKAVRREAVRPREAGGKSAVTLQVIPLRKLKVKCFLVLFAEADLPGTGQLRLGAARSEPVLGHRRALANSLAARERELAETRDLLQSVYEQSEAAGEELQASNEEVQSSNEELQSMNEELESSKEELESTNEELATTNDEMISRNDELSRANTDLVNLQTSLQTALLVLGRDLTIRRFTAPAEKIFNLVPTDLGRGFGGLRHTLDAPYLERLLVEVIDTMALREREVQDLGGRWYALVARPYLTLAKQVDGVLLMLTDIDALKRGEHAIKAARDEAQAAVRTMPVPYLILRADRRIDSASDLFYRHFHLARVDTEEHLIYELGGGAWDIPALRELLEKILPEKGGFSGCEITHIFPALGRRTLLLNARRVEGAEGVSERLVLTLEDITVRQNAQEALRESNLRTTNILESITDGFHTLDREWRYTYLNSQAEELLRPLGKTQENLLGKIIWEEFPDIVGTVVEDNYRRAANTRVKVEFELFYPPLNTWLEIRVFPSKDGLSIYFQDIGVRKAAAEMVKASERLYRAIGESIDYGVWTCDAEGRNTYASESFLKLVGLTQEQCSNFGWGEVLHPDDLKRTLAAWQECVRTRGTWDIEHRFRGVDGQWHPALARGVPVLNDDGEVTGWAGINLDIARQKQVEQALRESEDRFRVAAQAVSSLIWTNSADGRMEGEQPGWGNFTGQSPEEYQGYGWAKAVHPDDAQATIDGWNLAVAEKRMFEFEHRVRHRDGEWRTFAIRALPILHRDGQIKEWVGVHTDITEQRRNEAALREGEERFRTLADNISQLAWMADAAGAIFWYNRRWFDYTGTTLNDMTGWGWEKVHHPEHIARVVDKWRRHLASGQDWEDSFPLCGADGVYRWFLSRAVAIKDADGKVTRWFGTNTDITEQRRAADEVIKAKERSDSATRAKDEFLAALSHELRTPLSPVLLAAGALREDERLPADVREQLGVMERNIALEARLIDDLLDLTAIARGKLPLQIQPSDAHSLIGLATEIVRTDATTKEISIERQFAASHSGLMVDPARFQQVMWNLLRNAVKFTPTGGRIVINTSEQKELDGVRWLRIEVIDSGIGIDPADLERIFVPFEQGALGGSHRFGGLGLGLAIARAVVEMHGGRISAQSPGVGRGATFVVEFPGAIHLGSGISESQPPFRGSSSGMEVLTKVKAKIAPLRLLLVEDHESTLKTLSLLLRRDGHEVTTAVTVAEGLAAAAGGAFDLVVSDLGLPDGTRIQLMEKLRAEYGLRGIALTGYGMEEDLSRCREAGFVAHLVKPVHIAQLRSALVTLPAG
ncbi:MAG: CheR family methyltransferase [Opitutus sp.]